MKIKKLINKNRNLLLFLALFIFIAIILLLFLIIFPYTLNNSQNFAQNSSLPANYVIGVIDGDTFVINSGEKIRLLCVDAPEKNRKGYEESKEFLELAILNREVILNSSITDKDKYSRLLRYVYVDDNFINKIVLAKGYGNLMIIPPEECTELLSPG